MLAEAQDTCPHEITSLQLPGVMLATLLFSLAVFTLFYASLVWQRYGQMTLADARAARHAEQEDARA